MTQVGPRYLASYCVITSPPRRQAIQLGSLLIGAGAGVLPGITEDSLPVYRISRYGTISI
jgi:hypothetical protein